MITPKKQYENQAAQILARRAGSKDFSNVEVHPVHQSTSEQHEAQVQEILASQHLEQRFDTGMSIVSNPCP